MPIHLQFTAGTIRVTDVATGAERNLINLRGITIATPLDQATYREIIPGQIFITEEDHVVTVRTSDGLKDQWDVRQIDDGLTYPTTQALITAIQAALDAYGGGGGGGSTTYVALTDTPASITANSVQGGNAGGTALENKPMLVSGTGDTSGVRDMTTSGAEIATGEQTITSATTALSDRARIVYLVSATCTLPAAPTEGREVHFQNQDTGTSSIIDRNGKLIDGAATNVTLAALQTTTLHYVGGAWYTKYKVSPFIQSALDLKRTKTYNVYTALITQVGTADPTVVLMENQLSGAVVWTYVGVGTYLGTLTSAFTAGKTWCLVSNTGTDTGSITAKLERTGTDTVQLTTFLDGALTDGLLNNVGIEIRVYTT